ncbi:hypothetical protein [uncultured Nostoc sp.]|uniref:hypothetical protein n=1 Tax=uncultured Nostoc sp. TaxID=340711 RepID=UPI0035C9E51D
MTNTTTVDSIKKQSDESQLMYGQRLGQELVKKLKGKKEESVIREITLEYWQAIIDEIPNENSIKRPRTAIRKAIEEAFPSSEKPKPGYYLTSSGKGKAERYEHLSLWYVTTSKDRWDITSDNERSKYFAQWEKPSSEQLSEIETETKTETETETETKTRLQITLDEMNISEMQLDAQTALMVESALAHSGISLADFVRRAIHVYAKTITGKVKQSSEDLTAVSTEDLKSDSYKTHPGRAEELTRRAIYALEIHNNNCTEKAQKWHINQTAIQSLTGSKPATIKAILGNYQTRIDDHNLKHDLNPYDNRKGNGRKIELEIDLTALVPDGQDVM